MSTQEIVDAVRRGEDPILHAVSMAREDADAAHEMLQLAVRDARLMGYTWGQIGNALGITRQAAQQRFPTAMDALTGQCCPGCKMMFPDHDCDEEHADPTPGDWAICMNCCFVAIFDDYLHLSAPSPHQLMTIMHQPTYHFALSQIRHLRGDCDGE